MEISEQACGIFQSSMIDPVGNASLTRVEGVY
jgi:hypothetical protein